MLTRIALGLTLFHLATPLLSRAEVPACEGLFQREVEALGLDASEGVTVQRDSRGASYGRHHRNSEQVVGVQYGFLGSYTRIYIASPSPVFGGEETKQLILNERCQIRSVELGVARTGVFIIPRTCAAVREASRAPTPEAARGILLDVAPHSYWSKQDFLIDAVREVCTQYEADFARAP